MSDPDFILTRDAVAQQFPDMSIRAGILLLHNERILLVEEKSGNVGPPKGLMDWTIDTSVYGAALRMLRKETGVEIVNNSAHICHNRFIYRRDYHRELLVYYVVFVDYHPIVRPRGSDIRRYLWVNLREKLSGKYKCSKVSTRLFHAIDNSFFQTDNVVASSDVYGRKCKRTS